MNPKQNFRPSNEHAKDARYDRDGEPSEVDHGDPHHIDQGVDLAAALDELGVHPTAPRPRQAHVNRYRYRRGGAHPDLG